MEDTIILQTPEGEQFPIDKESAKLSVNLKTQMELFPDEKVLYPIFPSMDYSFMGLFVNFCIQFKKAGLKIPEMLPPLNRLSKEEEDKLSLQEKEARANLKVELRREEVKRVKWQRAFVSKYFKNLTTPRDQLLGVETEKMANGLLYSFFLDCKPLEYLLRPVWLETLYHKTPEQIEEQFGITLDRTPNAIHYDEMTFSLYDFYKDYTPCPDDYNKKQFEEMDKEIAALDWIPVIE